MNLQQIKAEALGKKVQYSLLTMEGWCLDSCDTLVPHKQVENSLFEEDLLLLSEQESIRKLRPGHELSFPCIHTFLYGEKKILDYTIKCQVVDYVPVLMVIMEDYTEQYHRVTEFLMDRNLSRIDLESEKQRNHELEKAHDFKVRFFQDLSHEIRNPLNNLMGLTEMILDRSADGNLTDPLKSLQATTRLLINISDNLLDISSVETSELKLSKQDTSVRQLAEEVMRTFAYLKTKKNVDFLLEIDPSVPDHVIIDPFRTQQILYNLVGNAAKFTPEGSITLRISFDPSEMTLISEVVDTGIGIPKEKYQKILRRFEQAEASTKEQFGGLGLGLNITMELIRLMDGSLNLKSKKSKGTTFTVTLPVSLGLAGEKEDSKEAWQEKSPRRGRILIADDDELSLLHLNTILRGYGLDVERANNGKEVIAKQKAKPFDLVILDYEMPEMNGYEVVRKVRNYDSKTPLVLLTGMDMTKGLEPGITACLTKPLKKENLHQLLVKTLGTDESSAISLP